MSNVTLFDNLPAEYKALLAKLQPDTNASGRQSSGGVNRLSIRGGVFRKVINGQEVGELEQRAIKAVLVKTAPITRMYYAGQFVQGQATAPVCWSADTSTGRPAPEVIASDRQSDSCFDCKQNIKGSGMGEGRACRFSQRVAVLLATNDNTVNSKDVYQLSLPATSVFGDNKQKMGLQTYARFLDSQRAPLASLLTEIRFDTDSSTPKLCFKAVRVLEPSELELAIAAQQSEDTEKLIALYIKPKEDTTPAFPKSAAPRAVAPPPKPKEEEEELGLFAGFTDPKAPSEAEPVEEPKIKAAKKKNDPAPTTPDLASLLDELDGFDD
jgi:hypothetical protein